MDRGGELQTTVLVPTGSRPCILSPLAMGQTVNIQATAASGYVISGATVDPASLGTVLAWDTTRTNVLNIQQPTCTMVV